MKNSKYNIYRHKNDDLFIYNTMSGGVLHLNQEYHEKFKKISADSSYEEQFPDLVENLIKGRMLVPEDVDETEAVIIQSNILRFSEKVYTLTIAPTMKCNFVCPYCYEVNKVYPQMEQNLVEKVKELFKRIKENHEYLSVAWYGGEPLLGFDIIQELSKEAINLFGEKYIASIVTNGYLLSSDIISQLEKLCIKQMQITLDGPPEIHNKRRKLPNGGDTFFVILNNIKKMVELSPDTKVTIRVNIDKENVSHVDKILSYLDDYGLRERVGFYLAPVDNINDTCNSSICFNNTEFAKEQLKFVEENLKRGYNYLHFPHANLGICGAVSPNSYVIDAIGDIYKCWDDVARTEHKIGNIMDDKIPMNKNLTKWLSYDVREDEECMNCVYLPVCMGGCPNQRIKGKKKCLPIKENAEEYIRLIYDLSKESISRK